MNENHKIKVGITHGDINGIGYELILKVIDDPRIAEICTPVIYGSAKIASYYRRALNMPQSTLCQIASPLDARDGENNIINVVPEDTKVEPGQPTAIAGQAAFMALERAVADLRQGLIDVLVTAPINKHSIQSDTFRFPGHTEYLEASLGDGNDRALMILCCDNLRVALVTAHHTSRQSGRTDHRRQRTGQNQGFQPLAAARLRPVVAPHSSTIAQPPMPAKTDCSAPKRPKP